MDLYRFFDEDGTLLYVGISLHAAQRASEHRKEKQWWADVARMDVEHLDVADRVTAQRVERDAIISEAPLYNVTHNRLVTPTGGADIMWCCAICDQFINDGDGYIEIPNAERRRFAADMATYNEKYPQRPGLQLISGTQLLELPRRARWWAIHRDCDPDLQGDGYWFDVARIRTHAQVIEWTSHLMGKEWLKDTDWDQVLRRVIV